MAKRQRKNLYWDNSIIDGALVNYQQATTPLERNAIYSEFLHEPLLKLSECIINAGGNRFQYYTNVAGVETAQKEIMSFASTILDKYQFSVGKSFPFFNTCLTRWIMQQSMVAYKHVNDTFPLDHFGRYTNNENENDVIPTDELTCLAVEDECHKDFDVRKFMDYFAEFLEKQSNIIISQIRWPGMRENVRIILPVLIKHFRDTSLDDYHGLHAWYCYLRQSDSYIAGLRSNSLTKVLRFIAKYYKLCRSKYIAGVDIQDLLKDKSIICVKSKPIIKKVYRYSPETLQEKKERRDYGIRWRANHPGKDAEYRAKYKKMFPLNGKAQGI